MAELDRRITLAIQGARVVNRFGESVVEFVVATVWAKKRDLGIDLLIETGGSRGDSRREWMIRWRDDVFPAFDDGRSVYIQEQGETLPADTDYGEQAYDGPSLNRVTSVAEPRRADRRRFLNLAV